MHILDCTSEMLNPAIAAGGGCYVIDEGGKRYVDFESGVWCAALGHNSKEVNDAIIRQINSVAHTGYSYTSKIVGEAAEKVLGLFHFTGGKCVFLSSGSEAVEFGVLAAKRVMKKPCFLCLKNHYLSAYGISAARSRDEWISLDLSEYGGDPAGMLKNVPFDQIGAFIFEPGNASGTVRLPPKELIKAIEGRIREHGGIIAVDEVTTGMGRTGKWFGFEHYGMRPDIVSFGKGVGNGYPVSVVAMSGEVADSLEKSGFHYAQSHQNDPLGCAVVNEVITVMDKGGLIQRAAQMGAVLGRELNALTRKHTCVKEARGIGLMYVLEFMWEGIALGKIHKELFHAGYIAGVNTAANVLRFYPPLIIEEEQIVSMANALDAILSRQTS